jgi:predicted nucleic acid-binding protein
MAVRKEKIAPRGLILDAGALIGWARGDARPRAMLRRALELGVDVRIPVAVLAETLRGGPRDAPIHRVRHAVDVMATTEATGRLAGALLGRSGSANAVDALVAAEAIALGADILTSDPNDLRALVSAHRAVAVLSL